MIFEQCADLWNGNLDIMLSYFSPNSLIIMATTNKALLTLVQGYFSRLRKKYPIKMETLISQEKGKWHISKDIVSDYLLAVTPLGYQPNKMIVKPISFKRSGFYYKIYGWVLYDKEKKFEIAGRWAQWVRQEDHNKSSIIKIIRWR